MGVEINNRGNNFHVSGTAKSIELTEQVLKEMYAVTAGEPLSSERVHLLLQSIQVEDELETELADDISIKTKRGLIRGRTPNQKRYVQSIQTHDVNFGIGPAGTGKTYLAVACAVAAMEQDRARRLVLVRPAVEAGEKLGFLPGDLVQKVDPYLRPLYDALYEMLGFEKVAKLIDRNVIEVAPLAFMRGRTLNESFIILDEAQNTTIEQMKMFLTRIGFNSTAVITGDITQIDLPTGKQSGLR
ncbi:MAG: PhoH family protein, partial [Proteobacteria bacterium]|nr:PhoH family protein [Pseudomonadota bacterium]